MPHFSHSVMPSGQRCSLMCSRQESSFGNSWLKSATVYRRCFGMLCLGFMVGTDYQKPYLLSRDNCLSQVLILKVVKVLCFDTLLHVLILKVVMLAEIVKRLL